ncbi:MAG: multidrug effflux MFS transporter [Nakamurella sp.]
MSRTTEYATDHDIDPAADLLQAAPRSGAPAGRKPVVPAHPGDVYVGRKYFQLVLILGAMAVLGPLTIDAYLPAFPRIATDLGASTSQVQLTLMAFLAGLAVGQLVIGPLSDSVGRRRPLMVGLLVHILASLVIATFPTLEIMTAARFVQGIGGAAVTVVSLAIVRDLFSGKRAAIVLSRLILVMGVGPIIAPIFGSLLMRWTSWHGVFYALAVVGVATAVLAWRLVPETLPVARRAPLQLRGTLSSYRILLRDRAFLASALAGGMVFGCLFAYVGGSSTALQEVYGFSPGQFALVLAAISLGFTVVSQVNSVLIQRWDPARVLIVVLGFLVLSAVVMTVLVRADLGVLGFLIPAFFLMVSCGLAMPNASAVSLQGYGERAGTAAAVLGALQFTIGAITSIMVGVLADGTANGVPTVALVAAVIAAALVFSVRRTLLARNYD